MTTMAARLRAWNMTLDDSVDVRALAVLRIAIGPVVLLHLRPFLTAARDGIIYSDRFTLPFWDDFSPPPFFPITIPGTFTTAGGLDTTTCLILLSGTVSRSTFRDCCAYRTTLSGATPLP